MNTEKTLGTLTDDIDLLTLKNKGKQLKIKVFFSERFCVLSIVPKTSLSQLLVS